MIFRPELLKKVLSGSKTVTRRRGQARYKVGRTYAVQPGRGQYHVAHIKVIDVCQQRLSAVTRPGEARREGFGSTGNFINYWKSLHGSISYSEIVTRIRFELAPRCPECAEA